MLVAVEELLTARVPLKATLLPDGVVSKFVPVIVTAVPEAPMVGVRLVMVGAPVSPSTKEAELVAVPVSVVTLIGPVVAPVGTLVTICVDAAEMTVAVVPLNLTVFWLGVVLKPVP
jgi:hypothetical protein